MVNPMTTTLLTTGLLCVIAAIVGGGIEAVVGKVPVIKSPKRQIALGIFGVTLLLGAFFSSSSKVMPTGSDPLSLPPKQVAKLRSENTSGHLWVWGPPEWRNITEDVYNGSDWTVKEVTIHVKFSGGDTGAEADENVALTLRDDPDNSGEPFKTSKYDASNFLPPYAHSPLSSSDLGIVSARGVRFTPSRAKPEIQPGK